MGFQKGHKPLGNAGKGRKKGVPNKVTASFREGVLACYEALGGPNGLVGWAQASPSNLTEFYKIAARLIPTEVTGPDGDAIPLKTIVEHHYS